MDPLEIKTIKSGDEGEKVDENSNPGVEPDKNEKVIEKKLEEETDFAISSDEGVKVA